jgi:hypothetical protein
MTFDTLITVRKAIISEGRTLRLSKSIEEVYYLFLEKYEWDIENCEDSYTCRTEKLKQKKLLWNGIYEVEANEKFDYYKGGSACI